MPQGRIAAVLLAVVVAGGLVVGAPRRILALTGSDPAGEVVVDCDVATAGVQSNCVLPSGTASLDVAVVYRNNSSAAVTLAAFNFDVMGDNQRSFRPKAPVSPPFNSNPDLDETALPVASRQCLPLPNPDANSSPVLTDSLLSCFSVAGGTTVAAGGTPVIGVVHYATRDGVAHFGLDSVSLGDETGYELLSCSISAGNTAGCSGATVRIGNATSLPSVTPEATSTATPNAVVTPSAPGTPASSPTAAKPVDLMLRLEGGVISWRPVASAASYRLTGEVLAVELNPSECGPIVGRQVKNIRLDETLPASASSFSLALPGLPPGEIWLVQFASLELRAVSATGAGVGGSQIGVSGDACFDGGTLTKLPPTGMSDSSTGGATEKTAMVLGAVSLVLGAGGLALLRVRRRST